MGVLNVLLHSCLGGNIPWVKDMGDIIMHVIMITRDIL